MSNDQYNDSGTAKFKPLEEKSIYVSAPITDGGETTSTGQRGMKDLTYNNNTLYGQIQVGSQRSFASVLATFDASATIPTASTKIYPSSPSLYAGSYQSLVTMRYQAMRLQQGDRDKAIVHLQTFVSGSGTVTVKVLTRADTSGQTVTFTTSDNHTFKTVEVAVNTNEVEEIEIQACTTSGRAHFIIQSYAVTQVQLASTTALTDVETSVATTNQVKFIPQDIEQYDSNSTLTVKMLRELNENANFLFRESVRTVYDYCAVPFFHAGLSPDSTSNTPGPIPHKIQPLYANPMITGKLFSAKSADADKFLAGAPRTMARAFYARRQGVTKLKIFATGYTNGWISGDPGAKITVMVRQLAGTNSASTSFYLNQAVGSIAAQVLTPSYSVSSGTAVGSLTWTINGQDLTLNDALTGLLVIDILGECDAVRASYGQIVAMSIVEKKV